MNWGQEIGSAGVAILLVAFALNLRGRLTTHAPAYLAMNLVGGAMACAASVQIGFLPFVVLEGVWTLVAGVSLIRAIRYQPTQSKGVVVNSGAGEAVLGLTGDALTIKLDSEATRGRYCVFEVDTLPSGGTALHSKTREDELMYVLTGEYEFQLGESTIRGGTGTLVLAPRGIPRCFTNIGNRPGRLLSVFTPAGIENMSREAARLPGYPKLSAAQINVLTVNHGIELM